MADEAQKKKKWRMHLLDELRGTAVVCMIFYHTFYLMGDMFKWEWGNALYQIFLPAEPYFASLFVIISGMACNLSKSNVERGVKLGIIALGITLATYIFDKEYMITFGVLHMLAVCMILYGLVSKYLGVMPIWLGVILNILLFVFLYYKVQFCRLFSVVPVAVPVFCRGMFRQADSYEEIPEMDGKKAYTAAGIRRQTRTFILCCPYACDLRNVYCSTVGSVVF